jgi:hypothetical protein
MKQTGEERLVNAGPPVRRRDTYHTVARLHTGARLHIGLSSS